MDVARICKDLFYCKIPNIFRWWRHILGSTLFVLQNFQNNLMYLPLKFPTSILIRIIEDFHKNSPVILILNSIKSQSRACFFVNLWFAARPATNYDEIFYVMLLGKPCKDSIHLDNRDIAIIFLWFWYSYNHKEKKRWKYLHLPF